MERRKRDEVQERPSKGVETTLNVIGGKWKLLILWHLAIDSRRYGQLRRLIPGITEKMLIQQLRELESDGIIGRNVFDEVPPRVEYFLTSHGRTLEPALEILCLWGEAHLHYALTTENKALEQENMVEGLLPDRDASRDRTLDHR